MNNIGIYKIVNKVNGKIYIGQSRDLKRRFTGHKRDLRNNKHYNSYLQYSYDKYGKDNFEFIIIENCDESSLNEREYYWVLEYNSHNRAYGYNAVLPKPNDNGFYHSEESKQNSEKSKQFIVEMTCYHTYKNFTITLVKFRLQEA